MFRVRGMMAWLVVVLMTALVGQPARATVVMLCGNNVVCSIDGSASVRPCCQKMNGGMNGRGCSVWGVAGVDYFSQRYVTHLWGAGLLAWSEPAITRVIVREAGYRHVPALRPPWEMLMVQGRGARPPPVSTIA